MNKKKLNYQFHNPNPDNQTANYILKIFMEANREKVEEAVQHAAQKVQTEEEAEDETVALAM